MGPGFRRDDPSKELLQFPRGAFHRDPANPPLAWISSHWFKGRAAQLLIPFASIMAVYVNSERKCFDQ